MFKGLKGLFGGKEKAVVGAPVSGKAIPMSQVNDPTFSQEILGKGVAIIPNKGRIVAPVDGIVTMVFDTKHAISMLDTVELKGEHFTALVNAGAHVSKGTPLLDFDMEKIKAAGYDTVTPVIVCNTPNFPEMTTKSGMDVSEGDTVIELN